MVDLRDPATMFDPQIMDQSPIERILVTEVQIVGGILFIPLP